MSAPANSVFQTVVASEQFAIHYESRRTEDTKLMRMAVSESQSCSCSRTGSSNPSPSSRASANFRFLAPVSARHVLREPGAGDRPAAERTRACGPPHLSKPPCGRSVICGERPATLRSPRVAAGGPAVRLQREAQLNAGSISSVTRLNWPFWSYPTTLSRIVVAPASTYLCRL